MAGLSLSLFCHINLINDFQEIEFNVLTKHYIKGRLHLVVVNSLFYYMTGHVYISGYN